MKITRKQFNKSQKEFKNFKLSNDDMHEMLSNIYKTTGDTTDDPILSPYSSMSFLFIRQKVLVLACAIFAVFFGTCYASAQSLPGDFLYGMKVSVIEPVVQSLKTNSKVFSYQEELLDKRIHEVDVLKAKDKLNEDKEEISAKVFAKTIKKIEKSIATETDTEKKERIISKINSYNEKIISDKHKIKSVVFMVTEESESKVFEIIEKKINVPTVKPDTSTTPTNTEEILDEEAQEEIKEVEDDIKEIEEILDITEQDEEDASNENDDSEDIEETVENVTDSVDKVKSNLGL